MHTLALKNTNIYMIYAYVHHEKIYPCRQILCLEDIIIESFICLLMVIRYMNLTILFYPY